MQGVGKVCEHRSTSAVGNGLAARNGDVNERNVGALLPGNEVLVGDASEVQCQVEPRVGASV